MARFHVRARTVDMLGRQQIAGIPTAISELFKNAHDAYARKVEVDYFREDDLLVLRDDGLGMTREDFEARWLTIGTESKLSTGRGLSPPPRDPSQPKRPVLGEKGIGRLAVAILGPQLFVLTRAKRNGVPGDKLVGAFLNWKIFELPGLDLDEIEIPVREFPVNLLPDEAAVKDMVAEFSEVVSKLADRIDQTQLIEIRRGLEEFDIDPRELNDDLEQPSLSGDGTGTHFFVKPVDRIIQDDIDTREADKATKIEKHLLGFTNTMTPGANTPPIVARFRDYPDEGIAKERIGDGVFFTPDEYMMVDHHIDGMFDEYGQFQGNVRVYQMAPDPYILNWNAGDGRKTLCGPFKFSVAILQGERGASLVPPEEFGRMSKKASRYGGIYIYRNGVRIQPYGDTDYDWLDIERRRTLRAAHYFYSFRRMFGAIELSSAANGALTEKAGREGFTENSAYRQFRSILINFFLQSAGDFFREEGKQSDEWEQKRLELQKADEIRKRRARQARSRRRDFESSLETFFQNLSGRGIETEATNVLGEVKRQSDLVVRSKRSAREKALALMRIERDSRQRLKDIRKGSIVIRPRIGLSRKMSNQWLEYIQEFERLDNEILTPIEIQVEKYVNTCAVDSDLPFHQFVRIDSAVRTRSEEAIGTVRRLGKESNESVSKFTNIAQSTARNSFKTVREAVDEVFSELEQLKRSQIDPGSLAEKRRELERKIDKVLEQEQTRLQHLREQFDHLCQSWSSGKFDSIDIIMAMEEELEDLQEQRDIDLEMAQIGMAVNIVSHEFGKTVGALRDGLRRMHAWAQANPNIGDLYRNMKGAFDHLDGYLSIFTPFDKRLHRTKAKIRGEEIYDFLKILFDQRLERHSVTLDASDAFQKNVVVNYPSTFYSTFANLVDNAIYWLQETKDRRRRIELDARNGDMLVIDNGPGVRRGDRINIFLFRFSRKPGGRGMGLYISRAALQKEGFDLALDENTEGAVFRIFEKEKIGGGS